MDLLLDGGIRLIVLVQSLEWLAGPMRFFSFLGSEYFFLLVLPAIYWCIDSALGLRVGLILLFSNGLNEVVKTALRGPRPYWYSPQVKALAAETSFGVPSGHAQIATGVWGMLAARLRTRLAWIAAGVIILLIGFSRIFLAVHFPHDVLLGWLLGGLTLWAFLYFWEPVGQWVARQSFPRQAGLSFLISAGYGLLGGLMFLELRGYALPQAWMTNALRAGDPAPAPISLSGILDTAGTFFGLAAGAAWMAARGGFRVQGAFWRRIVCFLVGLVGILILWRGLGLVFPSGTSITACLLRYVRYGLVGMWISAGAPWCFLHFRIIETAAVRRAI